MPSTAAMHQRIAIIGAGLAGLSCATRLAAAGRDVWVFDKGRGPGGRMSTRRVAQPSGDAAFDHGAQYFTARDPRFVAQVAAWEADGVVARWPAAGGDAWVGAPGMNAPVRALADGVAVAWSTRIDAIARAGGTGPAASDADGAWRLAGDGVDDRRYDGVVVAVPAEQAPALLGDHAVAIAARAGAVASQPCWTVMAAFDAPLPIACDVHRGAGDAAVGWAARDSSKPGRAPGERWVLQGSAGWSQAHLEAEATTVVDALLGAFAAQVGRVLPAPSLALAHRWRYARSDGGAGTGTGSGCAGAAECALWDPAASLGACGDWLAAPRVEGAWLSGRALADRILACPR